MKRTWEPGLSTIVATNFSQDTRELLVVEPQAAPFLPLQHGEVVAGSDAIDNLGGTPGSGVADENDTTFKITEVDLELYACEGDSTERSVSRLLSRVEFAFEKFRLKPHRRD